MKEPEGKMLTYVAKTTRVFCLVTARASRAAVTTGAASMLTTRTTMATRTTGTTSVLATRTSRASMLTSRTARSTALVTARAAVVASFMAAGTAGTAGTTLRAVLMFVMVVAEETHYVCVGVFMKLVDWRRGMRKMVMSVLSISKYRGAFGTLL